MYCNALLVESVLEIVPTYIKLDVDKPIKRQRQVIKTNILYIMPLLFSSK